MENNNIKVELTFDDCYVIETHLRKELYDIHKTGKTKWFTKEQIETVLKKVKNERIRFNNEKYKNDE